MASRGKLKRLLARQRVHNRVQRKVDAARREGYQAGRQRGVSEGITRLEAITLEGMRDLFDKNDAHGAEIADLPAITDAYGHLLPGVPRVVRVPLSVPMRPFASDLNLRDAVQIIDFQVVPHQLSFQGMGTLRWYSYVPRGRWEEPHQVAVDRLEKLARDLIDVAVHAEEASYGRGLPPDYVQRWCGLVLALVPHLRAKYTDLGSVEL